MPLPLKLDWELAQTKWKSQIEPILDNQLNHVSVLPGVVLINGVNVINHRLGRTQQGWIICDQNASAEIYRTAPFNDLTLTLTSSAVVTIDLGVF